MNVGAIRAVVLATARTIEDLHILVVVSAPAIRPAEVDLAVAVGEAAPCAHLLDFLRLHSLHSI